MRYAYALLIHGLARELVLVDVDAKRLKGEVSDLSHGAPYISPVEIIAGDYSDTKASDLIVITAGKKQKPGESRLALAQANVDIFRSCIPQLTQHSPDAVFLIVSNPVDVLSFAAYRFSGKPASQVIGSGTVLDSARLRFLLAQHCAVDPRNIHAYILGEHGDTEVAAWSRAMIGGSFFDDFCPTCPRAANCNRDQVFDAIASSVRDFAYAIIESKGETSYGIGLALCRITEAVLKDENAVLPVSSFIEGYEGIDPVYISLPAVVNRRGIRQVLPFELNEREAKALRRSAAVVQHAIKECGLR